MGEGCAEFFPIDDAQDAAEFDTGVQAEPAAFNEILPRARDRADVGRIEAKAMVAALARQPAQQPGLGLAGARVGGVLAMDDRDAPAIFLRAPLSSRVTSLRVGFATRLKRYAA